MKTFRPLHLRIHCAAALLVLSCGGANAEPYVPASDTRILARVPAALLEDPTLKRLRDEHGRAPDDLSVATDLAWRYLALARRTGALRYLGYAEAALRIWWTARTPPTPVLALRASIAQSWHEFDRSLEDLERLLMRDPRNATAWLMASTIQKVTGRPVDALGSCRVLRRTGTPLLHAACRANALSMTARARRAYEVLDTFLGESKMAAPGERQWALWVLAGLAAELELHGAADEHYAQALAVATPDLNLLVAYADHLLDTGRPRAALDLLDGLERKAPAVLRRAIALTRLSDPEVSTEVDWLRTHFADLRLRGDAGQAGDEARFELYVLGNSERALELAASNFEIHREGSDIRLLLDAALEARLTESAKQAIAWLDTIGYTSPAFELRRERFTAMMAKGKT
ncbi:MAG: tetratricopeptide repeat protein [Gammaproteobacteria bacterium]